MTMKMMRMIMIMISFTLLKPKAYLVEHKRSTNWRECKKASLSKSNQMLVCGEMKNRVLEKRTR